MLQSITLENFQSVGEFTTIPLGRITLIFGPNGAGKSSIFRAIKLIQSNLENLGGQPLSFIKGNTDLVGYKNLVFMHDEEKEMKIGFRFKALDLWSDMTHNETRRGKRRDPGWSYEEGYALQNYDILFAISNAGIDSFQFQVHFQNRQDELDQISSKICFTKQKNWEQGWTFDWDLNLENFNNFEALFVLGKMLERTGLWKDRYRNFYNWYAEIPEWPLDFPILTELAKAYYDGAFGGQSSKVAGLPPRAFPDYEGNDPSQYASLEPSMEVVNTVISDCIEGLKFNLQKLSWLGPLRKAPASLMYSSNKSMIGDSNFSDTNEERELLVKAVSKWLFMITERFKYSENIISSDLGDQIREQLVLDTVSGAHVGFEFVGVGLSQILPVLIEGFSVDSNLLLVEQPELHLHPRAQSEVADFLIEASQGLVRDSSREEIRTKEMLKERGLFVGENHGTEIPGKQIIVETHSENLILRFQRRIREGSLKPEDLTVLYVEPTGEGSTITHLRLSDTGAFLDKWPMSFQDTRLDDIL